MFVGTANINTARHVLKYYSSLWSISFSVGRQDSLLLLHHRSTWIKPLSGSRNWWSGRVLLKDSTVPLWKESVVVALFCVDEQGGGGMLGDRIWISLFYATFFLGISGRIKFKYDDTERKFLILNNCSRDIYARL